MQIKKIKFLSKKEVKRIEKMIEKNYGAKLDFKNLALAITGKDKIWIFPKQVLSLEISKLRLNSIGLYFGRLKANEKIRLSIEGCQLVGKHARKNIAILDESEVEKFIRGNDVDVKKSIECEENNFALVKFKDDFIGTGKFFKNKVENLIPKSRRLI